MDARIAILVDAFGPKCFVMISMHIKDSQDMRIPPSRAIQSVWTSVLLASRFMQITLTTKRETAVAGIHRSSITVSSFSLLNHVLILEEFCVDRKFSLFIFFLHK